MSQALYRKWRPARFDHMVGQEHVTHTLQQATAAGRIGHAYLFCGPRGTGKTTTARLLAKAVNCLDEDLAQRPCNNCSICHNIANGRFLDLIEIDAASNTGVDDIRDLRDKINFSPSEGRFKVYIIDEVHMLSPAAFNALLKTLEEPPPHAIFILATTEDHKVPLTIKSRCQQFNFRLLTTAEIMGRLEWVAAQEGLTIEPQALAMIAQHGAGSVRDAESLLDQLVAAPGDTITLERAQAVLGTASTETVRNLTEAWLNNDGPAGLAAIHHALASGADARQLCRQMVFYLRRLLLLAAGGDALPLDVAPEEREGLLAQAQRVERNELIAAVKRFNEAAMAPASSWQPQLPLELAFVELLSLKAGPTPPAAPPAAPQAVTAPPPVQAARPEADRRQQAETARSQDEKAPAQPQAQPDEPPPPPADEAPAPVKPAAAGPLTLQMVTAHWREMAGKVNQQNRNLGALLNSCKPLAVEGEAIILGFDFPLLKEKFDKTAGAGQLIGQLFEELSGRPCHIRAVVVGDYTPPRPAKQTNVSREEFHALAQELGGVVEEK